MIGITLLMLDLVSGVKLKIVSQLWCCCAVVVGAPLLLLLLLESPRLAPIIKTRAEIDSDTSGWRIINNTHLQNHELPLILS